MAFVEDLTPFLADFGVDGTLAGSAVRGIFDAPSDVSMDIVATVPQFQMKSASVPAAIFDATLVIPQGTFKVREALPDGTGMTLLLLMKT